MEDLDVKIDTMCREKLFTLIQDNSVRFKKINIRQTKNNKKNSIEHLDELYASYDRLLRSIPKDILKLEQTIRLKFQVPLNEERKVRVLSNLHEEMELIIGQMVQKFQELYRVKGCLDDFNARIEQTRSKSKENLESAVDKLVLTLNKELETSKTMSPDELQSKYGIDKEAMNQMHLVKVLQGIHIIFDNLKNTGIEESVLNGVHEGIIERVKFGKKVENEIPPTHDVIARKTWRMRVARETVKLKEMIYSLHTLAEYLQKQEDQRNYEVIHKIRGRIEESFDEFPKDESERVLSKLKPFYDLLSGQNN
ncbi:MAG: hypothetical protein NPINA01_13440 [Nitrospinaceae bacterium]|nr:MAG: hypothetical protein NPINA01_13440 [Nitrospinaceae bacterium]